MTIKMGKIASGVPPNGAKMCFVFFCYGILPSVLGHCWLGGRKGTRSVKKLSGGMLVWLCVWVDVQICIWPS